MAATRTLRTAAVAAVVLLAAAGSAEAGPPGKWSQVTGVGADDGNPMRPDLARTADGVLHVSWTRDLGGGGSLLHSAISADAKTVSGPVSIYDNVAGGVNYHSDLVVAPDGTLRAFFAATNVFDNVLATATSANGGASWTVGGSASKNGAPRQGRLHGRRHRRSRRQGRHLLLDLGRLEPRRCRLPRRPGPDRRRWRAPRRPAVGDQGRGGLGQRTGGLGLELADNGGVVVMPHRTRGWGVSLPDSAGSSRRASPAASALRACSWDTAGAATRSWPIPPSTAWTPARRPA